MSQVKNSTGPEDLSLAYRIESEVVTTDHSNQPSAAAARTVLI
jgi:hypothetical protein